MLMTCFTHNDTRCKTTKALLEVIVIECHMSRKQDDCDFCGRRVPDAPDALLVSQEFAASSVVPMELRGPQRSAETVLTCSEHREYRSLLVKIQWLQLQSRPDLSCEVNRAAQRSSAPRSQMLERSTQLLSRLSDPQKPP